MIKIKNPALVAATIKNWVRIVKLDLNGYGDEIKIEATTDSINIIAHFFSPTRIGLISILKHKGVNYIIKPCLFKDTGMVRMNIYKPEWLEF